MQADFYSLGKQTPYPASLSRGFQPLKSKIMSQITIEEISICFNPKTHPRGGHQHVCLPRVTHVTGMRLKLGSSSLSLYYFTEEPSLFKEDANGPLPSTHPWNTPIEFSSPRCSKMLSPSLVPSVRKL